MNGLALPGIAPGRVVRPGDRRYDLLRSTYTTLASPAVVVLPENAAEVTAALSAARASGLPLSVRSGGHGLPGRSSNNGGIVIDLSAMRNVDIRNARARLVRIEAGARWANVAAALAPHGWAISSGDHGNVGVGGLATAGGIGWLARSYGLTIDHIRAVDLMLADGTLVRADEDHEPDLFWAARGAGDSVGIALAFEIEAAPVASIGFAQVVVEADRAGRTLRRWSEHMTQAARALTSTVTLFPNRGGFAAQFTAVVADDDPETTRRLVEPFTRFGARLLDQHAQIAPYAALVPAEHLHPNVGQQPVTVTNALLPTLTEASAEAIMDAAAHPSGALVQLRALGGAINDSDPAETAYPHRHQQVLVIFSEFPPAGGSELDLVWKSVEPHADGAYRGFESRPDEATFRRAFPGPTGDRLAGLRGRFDPDGVFRRPTSQTDR
jgi:FAD/FMN-containing dehydrogenase